MKGISFYSAGNCPDWLEHLLPVDKSSIFTSHEGESFDISQIPDKSVLICRGGAEHVFVSHCESMGFRYGLFVLGDENLQNYMGYITSPLCLFAVRSYYHPIIHRNAELANCTNKLLFLRVGTTDEFFHATRQKVPFAKKFTWSFAGEMKPGRYEAIKTFSSLKGGYLHLTNEGFKTDQQKKSGLKANEYLELIQQSVFTLCPMGWINIDNQRIYEALDAGSIPVVIKNLSNGLITDSYWKYIFTTIREPPFIIAESWEEALSSCKKILELNKVKSITEECIDYWSEVQERWKNKIFEYCLDLSTLETTNPIDHRLMIAHKVFPAR